MQRDVVDANRSDGGRFIVESDELLSAFLELEELRVKFRNAGRSSYFWRKGEDGVIGKSSAELWRSCPQATPKRFV
jgi:hypothetical protein